jgi:hypothetical protein
MKALTIFLGVTLLTIAVRADEPKTNGWPDVSVTPAGQYVTVRGDQDQFRADHWGNDGWTYGVDSATLHQSLGKDTSLDFSGRAIVNDGDFKLSLDITKNDVGFIRAGFTQYRQYFDTSGGYFKPFSVPSFSLPGDWYLDIGKIYADIGLTLPNLPKLTLGYERDYRDGQQSLLQWGSVTEGADSRKIFPSYQNVNEHVDIFKFGVEHDIKNIHVDNQFRYEYYRTDTDTKDGSVNLNTSASSKVSIQEEYNHDAFYDTFRMDSHLNNKVYWSFGYLFTTINGNAGTEVITPPPLTANDKNWATQAVDNDLNSSILSLNAMFGPFAGLTLYTGVQAEFTDTDGFTDALLTEGVSPTTTNRIHSSNNKQSLAETAGLRYTKIKYTTLYAEARLTEQDIDLSERETADGTQDFKRQTDTTVMRQDYRVGFNTSPWRRITLTGQYRYAFYHNDYNNNVDTTAGYPAFITLQDFETDEALAKVTVRPCSRVSLAFTYRYVETDIKTTTDSIPLLMPGGELTSGRYNANVYSVSTTVTPMSRLYLTGLFSLEDTHTTSFDNHSPTVVTYYGNVYTAGGSAGFAVDKKTDFTVQYTYSCAQDSQGNSANGLPLGADSQRQGVIAGLTRKFNDHFIGRLRYGWYQYDDKASGGANNYTAQLLSASCTARF